MMGYRPDGFWDQGSMMNGSLWGVHAFFAVLYALVIFIDLVLLGVWLWKQIQKK